MTDFNPNPHPPAGAVSNDPARANMPEPAADQGKIFDEAYVHTLREEAAGYRTQFKPFKDAFDGYDGDELAEWLDLAQTLKSDPMSGADRFEEIARQIRTANGQIVEAPTHKTADQLRAEAQAESNQPAPARPAEGEDRPLTVGEYNRFQAAQAERARQEAIDAHQDSQVADVYAQAAKLGYESGTKEIVELFWVAQNETNGDITAAASQLKSRDQEIIRKYMAQVQGDHDVIPMPVRGGVAPSNSQTPKTFGDARASLEARLSEM